MADAESTNDELRTREHTRLPSIQSELNADKDRIGSTVLATFIAALGPLSFGFCLGYSFSALEDLASESAAVRLPGKQGSWFSA